MPMAQRILGLQAAEAQLNIFMEKPMTTNSLEAQKLLAAAKHLSLCCIRLFRIYQIIIRITRSSKSQVKLAHLHLFTYVPYEFLIIGVDSLQNSLPCPWTILVHGALHFAGVCMRGERTNCKQSITPSPVPKYMMFWLPLQEKHVYILCLLFVVCSWGSRLGRSSWWRLARKRATLTMAKQTLQFLWWVLQLVVWCYVSLFVTLCSSYLLIKCLTAEFVRYPGRNHSANFTKQAEEAQCILREGRIGEVEHVTCHSMAMFAVTCWWIRLRSLGRQFEWMLKQGHTRTISLLILYDFVLFFYPQLYSAIYRIAASRPHDSRARVFRRSTKSPLGRQFWRICCWKRAARLLHHSNLFIHVDPCRVFWLCVDSVYFHVRWDLGFRPIPILSVFVIHKSMTGHHEVKKVKIRMTQYKMMN